MKSYCTPFVKETLFLWSSASVYASRISRMHLCVLQNNISILLLLCQSNVQQMQHFNLSLFKMGFCNVGNCSILLFLQGTMGDFSTLVYVAQHANELEMLPIQFKR